MAAPSVVNLSKDDPDHRWVPYEGPFGGQGWQSLQTGEIRYQDESPETGETFSPDRTPRNNSKTSVHDAYKTPHSGDEVMVLPTPEYDDADYPQRYVSDDGPEDFQPGEEATEPFKGTFKEIGGDYAARRTWAVVETEDGEEVTVSSDRLFVVDGVMPDEGEPVDYESVETGDRINVMTTSGKVNEHVVLSKDDETMKTYRVFEDGGGTVTTTRSIARMSRVESGVEINDPEVVVSKTNYDDFGYRELSEDDVQTYFETLVERSDNEVMSDVFSSLETVEDKSERNAWSDSKDRITFKEDASKSTLAHELMHAVVESEYGYSHHDECTAFAKFFVNTFPGYEFGKPASEVYQDMVTEQVTRFAEEEGRDAASDLGSKVEALTEEIFENDFELTREDFLLTLPEDKSEDEVPDKVSNFVNEVNNAWNKTMDAYEEEGKTEAMKIMPYRPYCVTNAHELAAGIQEIMQSEQGKESHISPIMDHHPDLIEAYLNLFEPSEAAKEVMERTTEHSDPEFEYNRGEWQ